MATCRECGGEMLRTVEKAGGVPVGPIALFVVGLALLVVFPVGTAIGILLIGAALVLGYPRKKAWKCPQCGFEHV